MAKLKCNNCGHLNPVKSEFMTFCEKCGKKLSNNFQEWKKFNPGKTFNNYKIEINTEDKFVAQPNNNKPKGKKPIALIIGLIIAVFLLAEGYYLGYRGKQQLEKVVAQRDEMNNLMNSPNWRLMEDKTGNFKIRFPGTAQKDIQTQEMDGETLHIVSYILEANPKELGNHLYGVTFLKYPGNMINHLIMSSAELDEFFVTVINSSASTVGGEVKSISEQAFNGFPGRRALIRIQNGLTEVVYWDILIDNTLYLLQVICPVENTGNESINTFFNSFEILSN